MPFNAGDQNLRSHLELLVPGSEAVWVGPMSDNDGGNIETTGLSLLPVGLSVSVSL